MPHFSPGCRTNPTLGATKAVAAEQFKNWWKSLPQEDVTVFSDGSEQSVWPARGRLWFRHLPAARKVWDGLGTINSVSHVFDAEAIGAWKGLKRFSETLHSGIVGYGCVLTALLLFGA